MHDLTKNEELILLSIWKLKDNAYGVTIRENFKRITGKILNYGSLYNSLYHLLRKDLVNSTESVPLSKRGGRRKILYSLTGEGHKALSDAQRIQKVAWGNVPDFVTDKKNE